MFSTLFARIKAIVSREGFTGLLGRGLTFPARQHFLGIEYEARYHYEHTIKKRNSQDFMPDMRDSTLKIVRTNRQADELEANGYKFRSCQKNARKALDNGAIAFCIFVQQEIAHIGWIALTENAKPYVDDWPYEVDFANKEACTGGTLTMPKFRGHGFMKYGYYRRFEFLREMGIVKSRNSVGIYNFMSHRVHAKFNPRIYAKARYLKVFRWISRKESPLNTVIQQN